MRVEPNTQSRNTSAASLPSSMEITLTVNGTKRKLRVAPWTTLLDALRDYLDQIIKMTEASQKGDPTAGAMIDTWLGNWADGNALTKVDSQQGGFERKWILSGLLIAYWRNSPHADWKNTQKIEKFQFGIDINIHYN